MPAKKGKLIVIDGNDGSGKATQVEMLIKKLRRDGKTVKMVDFPEYYQNFFGAFIGHCLREQYYNFLGTHPKIASVLYAADRWESKDKIEGWLKKGYIVVANRYVSANQIHQGGKIKSEKKRKDFLKWLDTMEHEVFGIPRPDVIIYLSLPFELSRKLMKERDRAQVRRYLLAKRGKTKGDVHETNPKFLENSQKSALKLVKELNNFVKVDCAPKGIMRTREDIHEEIVAKLKPIVKK